MCKQDYKKTYAVIDIGKRIILWIKVNHLVIKDEQSRFG